jgi:hypothetical protein
MIAPYAASLDPITNAHQKVAVTFHMVVFDSFHLGATFTACKGGVSSVSEGVASGVYWYLVGSPGVGGQDARGLELALPFISVVTPLKTENFQVRVRIVRLRGMRHVIMRGKQLANVTPIPYV